MSPGVDVALDGFRDKALTNPRNQQVHFEHSACRGLKLGVVLFDTQVTL
jgi:hypothetical protein